MANWPSRQRAALVVAVLGFAGLMWLLDARRDKLEALAPDVLGRQHTHTEGEMPRIVAEASAGDHHRLQRGLRLRQRARQAGQANTQECSGPCSRAKHAKGGTRARKGGEHEKGCRSKRAPPLPRGRTPHDTTHSCAASPCWPVSGLTDEPLRPSRPVRRTSGVCAAAGSVNSRPLTVAGAAQVGRSPMESAFLLPV